MLTDVRMTRIIIYLAIQGGMPKLALNFYSFVFYLLFSFVITKSRFYCFSMVEEKEDKCN